jgi:KDO2-lipid IV(A) lauroyltransferase
VADYSRFRRRVHRWLTYPLEAVGAWTLYGLLLALPVDAASAFGGWLLRRIGPHTRAERIARDNLTRSFPEMDDREVDAILREVWDNTGRVFGEWPHLGKIEPNGADGRIEVVGANILAEAARGGGPVITVTGHYGSWEVAGHVSNSLGCPTTVVYRPLQNPWVAKLVEWGRGETTGGMLPKGREAAAGALEILRRNGWIGILFDQKLNEGVPVPFFGREAMTSPLVARLAVRFRCPVIPIRADRLGGARFKVTVYPPLEIPDTGDRARDQETLLLEMNRMLEGWIRECPGQWFWLHKRWSD